VLSVWLHWQGGRGDDAARFASQKLARASLVALLVGVALGFLLLGRVWLDADRAYWEVLGRVPVRLYSFALAEIGFSVVCLWLLIRLQKSRLALPLILPSLALLSSSNLLYHFPPWMTTLRLLATRPELAEAPVLSRAFFLKLMFSPEVLSQTVHFAVASVAVSALALMWIVRKESARLTAIGAWIVLGASFSQFAIGFWVLMQLPIFSRNELLGGHKIATGLFLLAIVGTLEMMHRLIAIGMGETGETAVRRVVTRMVLIVLLMVVAKGLV